MYVLSIMHDRKIFGSGALSGLMMDLGLLKISLGGVFFLFLDPAEPYPNPIRNPAG